MVMTLNKRDKKYIDRRLEDWGLWMAQDQNILGFSDRNPIADVMEYHTRVNTNRVSYIPNFELDYYNRKTNYIVRDLERKYFSICYYEYAWHHIDTGERVRRKLVLPELLLKLKTKERTYFRRKSQMFKRVLEGLAKFKGPKFRELAKVAGKD